MQSKLVKQWLQDNENAAVYFKY